MKINKQNQNPEVKQLYKTISKLIFLEHPACNKALCCEFHLILRSCNVDEQCLCEGEKKK